MEWLFSPRPNPQTAPWQIDEGDKSLLLAAVGGGALLLGALYFALSTQVS